MQVLVARPSPRAEETAARLTALGHVPVLAPVLSIVPLVEPPPPGPWGAVLVTSRNAVPALVRHRADLDGIPIFAVGTRTGGELRRSGFDGVVSGSGDAADLAALVSAHVAPGAKVLHAAGRHRRPEPARSLQADGYALTTWEVYAAEPAQSLPQAARSALAAGELEAVLHYSPRSATILLRLADEAGLAEAFGRLRHLCLAAQVAAAIDGIDPARVSVALEPSENQLLALLDPPTRRAD